MRPILNVALAVERATHNAEPAGTSVFVTGEVYRDLADTQWRERLKLAEIQSRNRLPANITFYRLGALRSWSVRYRTPKRLHCPEPAHALGFTIFDD